MTVENLQYLINTYGLENLRQITLNNSRNILITDDDRDKLEIDYDKKLLKFTDTHYVFAEMQHFQTKEVVIAQEFDLIECLIFIKPKE